MKKKIKTLKKTLVYKSPWLKVHEHKIKRGNMDGMYSVVDRDNGVIIIPLSPSQKTILLKQFRYPANSYSWEFPMGGIRSNETTEKAAKRELMEETSLKKTRLKEIAKYHPDVGLMPQKTTIFVAEVDDDEMKNAEVLDETEDICELKIIKLRDVYRMAAKGKIIDGWTLVALFYLQIYMKKTTQIG